MVSAPWKARQAVPVRMNTRSGQLVSEREENGVSLVLHKKSIPTTQFPSATVWRTN